MRRDENKLYSEAKAMFFWGDELSAVKKHLINGGVSECASDEAISGWIHEKKQDAIKENAKKCASHCLLSIICVAAICFLYLNETIQENYPMRRGAFILGSFITFVLMWSAWKLIDCVIALLKMATGKDDVRNL